MRENLKECKLKDGLFFFVEICRLFNWNPERTERLMSDKGRNQLGKTKKQVKGKRKKKRIFFKKKKRRGATWNSWN